MKTYKDLLAWQKAMDLVVEIYNIVKFLPREELYGLSDQMRRAAVSVVSNIAEGHGRNSEKEFIHFLNFSYGSLCELETQLEIAKRVGYLRDVNLDNTYIKIDELSRIEKGLMKSLMRNIKS